MSKKNSAETVVDQHTKATNLSMGGRVRGYLLAGILVTAPISITVYLTWVFLTFIDTRVAKILPDDWYAALYGGTTFPGLGLVIALVFFVIVGWFAKNFFGRLVIRLSEYIVHRMPVIRTLYGAIKQIFETIMASQSSAFREAVMLEYPRKGVYSIGFVTGKTEGEVQRATKNETINVFVPTTPNPTSGYLLFVPKKELIYLDMSVEEAIKLVVSAGIITPPDKSEGKGNK
ncbi:MAG: membrane protein [Micavibrio sp.]|nr:MAG: membrane protein [Micavibrio sp.]